MSISSKRAARRVERLRTKRQESGGLNDRQKARLREARQVTRNTSTDRTSTDRTSTNGSQRSAAPTPPSRQETQKARQTVSRLKERKEQGALSDKQQARLRAARAVVRSPGAERSPVHRNIVRSTDGQTLIAFNKKKGTVDQSASWKVERNPALRLDGKSANRVNSFLERGWQTRAPKKGQFSTRVVNVAHTGRHRDLSSVSGFNARRPGGTDPANTSLTLYLKKRGERDKGRGGDGGGRRRPDGRREGPASPNAPSGGRPEEPSVLGDGPRAPGSNLPAFGNPPTYETGGQSGYSNGPSAPGPSAPQSGYNGGVGYRQGPQDDSVDPIGAAGSDGFIRTYWGDAPERTIDYADRLGDYNRANIDWLDFQGQQSGYEMGKYLNDFARAIPPAPDTSNGYDEVLGFLERANRRLYS